MVSSDHRIQNAATRRKAKAIDSDVWLDQIESQPRSSEDLAKGYPDNTTPATPTKSVGSEIKSHDWNAEFGIEDNAASEELVREIENELGTNDSNEADSSQDIAKVEDQFKDVDWMSEFGFDNDDQ